MIEKLRTIASRTHFEKSIMKIKDYFVTRVEREIRGKIIDWLRQIIFMSNPLDGGAFISRALAIQAKCVRTHNIPVLDLVTSFVFFKTFLLLLLFNWPCFRLLTLKFLSANMNLEKLSDDLGGAVDCKWSRSPHLIKLRLRNLFIIS